MVEGWVESKFMPLSLEDLSDQTAGWNWDRIDPWLAQRIEADADFSRVPGHGQLEGHMLVQVVIGHDFAHEEEVEPITGLWPYSDLKRHGFNPLSNAEVAEFAAGQWEGMFEGGDDDMAVEFLGETVWVPRGSADANADGVGKFARLAGACGFYVFDVRDKVILGIDYDARDAISTHWSSLYSGLTGNKVGTLSMGADNWTRSIRAAWSGSPLGPLLVSSGGSPWWSISPGGSSSKAHEKETH